MFESLHIRAYLQCGVNGEKLFPFDQILFYLAMRDRYGVEPVTAPLAVLGIEPVVLPLKVLNPGSLWFYAASYAQWPNAHADYITHWHKRFDLSFVSLISGQERQRSVRVDAMRYKSYRMPQFLRHAIYIDWYCVGDRQEIERLLSSCLWIGKKTAQGDGAVLRWEVEAWPEDWSVYGPNAQLMRAIPSNSGPIMGIRPSYYDRVNQTHCVWHAS